jgi:type II secretion system protein C
MMQFFIKILFTIVIVKTISLVVSLFLPSSGVDIETKNDFTPTYQRVDFKNMLTTNDIKTKTKNTVLPNGINITNMLLKGLFGTKTNGYAIVALKSNPTDTTLLSVGDNFNDYKLLNILSNKVVFVKNNKQYILKIDDTNIEKNSISYIEKNDSTIRQVSKNELNYYLSNPKEIWKDIAISTHSDPKGYKVDRVKKGSSMDKLGLQKGDIIIKANNVKLESLKDVMKIYNNINNITAMEITVLRDNTEVELMYEID